MLQTSARYFAHVPLCLIHCHVSTKGPFVRRERPRVTGARTRANQPPCWGRSPSLRTERQPSESPLPAVADLCSSRRISTLACQPWQIFDHRRGGSRLFASRGRSLLFVEADLDLLASGGRSLLAPQKHSTGAYHQSRQILTTTVSKQTACSSRQISTHR